MRTKGFTPIAILAVLAVAGIIAVLLLTTRKDLLTTEIGSLNVPSQTLETSPTAQTYKNDTYGFSFKYPEQLALATAATVSAPLTGNPVFITTLADSSSVPTNTDAPFHGFSVTKLNSGNGTFEAFIDSELMKEKTSPRGLLVESATYFTVNGQSAAFIDSENDVRRYFVSGDKIIIAISTGTRDEAFLGIVDQILETFRFTK